ncbi:helix-turn-helix domain-containing protein [Nocardia sp. CA-135398]|uniref:helix-turn-helix domain-containing protein n=1 Tax=Nocardia sp. CA-135398 TaxID=3239977 RepID=UPI003D963511
MDGSLSLNPVVQLRNSFESLPAVVRRPIEMVVFGGELPRADISGMRRMAAEFRVQAAALNDRAQDTKELLAQEDSMGVLGERLRETLGLHRDGATRLGDDALALADQVQAAANDAEKTLCVMFVFGIELAWRIFGVLSAAAAAGPAGEVAAVPVAESMLIEGRASVAGMRAGLDQAFRAGATRTAARRAALGALQLPVTLAKAAALPVGVDAGVQALQAASGDRTLAVIGSDGENPTGIDLTSIKVAALAGAGGAVGGMVAGRVAPKVFPRIEGSRLALGLVHGTAGAVAGLGAAALVTGWPDHFDHVLAPLLNGGFAGVVHAHALARPGSAAPTGAMIDGGGAFTRPDLPAAIRSEAAAGLPPIEVSAESKQAWEAAKAAWATTPDTVAAAGAEVPTAGADGNTGPVKSGESRSPAVSGSMPHDEATGRAQLGLGSAGRSETDASVPGPQRGESVVRTNATAQRTTEAGAEASAPQKVSTSTPTRQAGTGPETPAAAEHRSPGNHQHGNAAKVSAAADEHRPPVDARPATGTGDRPETHAVGEHRSPGNHEYGNTGKVSAAADEHQAPVDARPATGTGDAETPAAGEHRLPGNEEHAIPAERSVLAGETGDEVSAGPVADHVDGAGSPAPSARDQAVDLLADFHAGSGDRVPEQLRLCNLPDEVLKAGMFDTDARKSMIATAEIIRRGTISDAVPGGMVLRVEQAEGLYALDKRPVEMKPGEGKSLMFMAAAMQRAVRHGECLLVTTTDGLAHREFTRYRQLLTDLGIDVFRADQQQGFGPVAAGRPAVVVATGETVGHLCNAGHRPPRHALIDEMDGIIDRGERQFLRSEGVEQAAPEATAREVFAAHDFLAEALAKGTLSHEDFGLTRIIEEVGLNPDGTPELEFWYDGRAELTPGGREKVEALPGGKQWLAGLGLSRLETAAAAEFTCRKSTHYVMDAGKIVIIDQGEHGLQRNPTTSSESRWSAEQGKASLAQAVEAKEIRSAEALGMSAEQHQIVVRADADSAKSINAVEIYRTGGRPEDRFFDEVTGASGTLADLNPVLEKIYGLEEAHQVDRAQEQRLMEGAPEVVANTRAKLSAIAEGAHRVWQGGRGRSQEILCHRNDLVDRQVQALVRQGVPREAIEAVDAERIAGWGAEWEGQLQKVFDAAGEQGKILVINRQGQRGVDIAVSEAVQAKGGMFVWMTEVPEQSYIHEQAKNRTARNGDRGSAQALMSPQDALIRNAMHLHGVREVAVRYDQAAAAHRSDPTPENHHNLVEASHDLGALVPELQQRALRHATADFIRHHAYLTDNPAAVVAAAEALRYQGSTDIGQMGQPEYSPGPAAHMAGLLGIPAAAVAALEQDGADDPLGSLLERTGLPPAAVEALRQQVEATARGTVEQYAGLTDEQALDQLLPQRDRLAEKLGWDTEAIEGAEGMRTIDPALTEARNNLAKTLGYPASEITPAIARDILGEAVGRHLSVAGTAESATSDEAARDDAAPISTNPVSVVAENPVAEDVIAAASHYLATAALLDLVMRIHRRSPNSCVNNAVTGMRVLSGRDIAMPSSTLAGHGRDAVANVFGAPLENAGSLDGVAESLRARPGGITVLVYKWKDTPATASPNAKATGLADDHMVLVVNDSEPGEAPKLVVVDLAASRDGDTSTDYGPKDLRNRRTLLAKAVPFDTWRQEQQKFIGRLPADKRRFETIEFDVEGNLVASSHRDAPAAETPPRSQEAEVSAELVQEINAIQPGWPVNGDGPPDLPSRTDADTPDKSDIPPSAAPARIGSRPHNTPDPAEPAPGQEPATLSATPTALEMAVAVVAGIQCGPDIAWDAKRFVIRCYEEYRQQQRAALLKRRRTALVNRDGMPPEQAEQAAGEYVGSAEARTAIDDAAAQDVGGLIVDMHRTADRAQISLPGSLADLYRAEANTANARKLQQAFALIGRDESSPVIAQDAKRFVMSCYAEYRQRQESAARNGRRTTLMNRHGMTSDEAEQAAREHVGSADVRAHIDSAAADNTRRLIHNIAAERTKTSLPLVHILAHLHQAEATTANARGLAKSMKAETGEAGTERRARGDQVGSRPSENSGAHSDGRTPERGLPEHVASAWQVVIGPGTDTSDPGTLADAVAARLPESGSARARADIIDAVARLAELTLPRAGAEAVLVVTSSEDADGRRRLLVELDYTRPDATDPAPGVTAEELRRELSDVDGRIDVDTADPLPDGQVRHRVRLDLTRQRILVCCRVWGSGGTGMSTLNVALCEGLAAAGHEVIVWAGEVAQGSRLSGVKLYGDPDSGASRRPRYDGGPNDLPQSVDLVIVHAEDGGIRATLEAQIRYPAARFVSVHHLTPMLWETLRNSPVRGRAKLAARIYLARRAHLVAGLGPVLATDALSAAVMAGHGSVHQLQPGLEIAEQPPEPAPDDPAWILLFGRVDDELKGAAETAEAVRRLRAQGRDVRLVVRGYPERGVEVAHTALARLVGDPDAVEVRPYTTSRAKLRDDIRAATIVVMPSRAEGFGGVAIEAIEQGVPVAVPSSSGVGRFLADLADYRDLAQRFNLVEQPLGAQVPIDNWVAGLGSVLDDLPGAWAAARGLQGLMRPYTRENSARMLVHAARNTDPHSRSAIRQSRTQVSFEDGRVVARGEEEDYQRILAVADAMESDPAVREAVIGGTRIEFAPSPDLLTTGTAPADDSGARSRTGDDKRLDNRPATGRNGGPGGLIGSRPFEDSPGERAFAGPGFEDLVLAGRQSGIAERFVVEDGPGVRVEELTFGNGVRVFMETYADPIDALVQVLRTKVAIMMGAPVAHAMLNLEDDRVYRELTPGRPGDSVDVVDPEVLDSDSALRLGLFDAVTGIRRTAREWSVADDEVMGGRSGPDVDTTQIGVFASLFVRYIDGRAVWLDHAMPTWDIAPIRDQVSHLDTWISNFPMPQQHRTALLDIHAGYEAALAQVERHAVHTFGERAHRAGLDAQAQAKARSVEVFTLNYPHVAVVGFDHPDVPADVVEEILGGLDEMFTRFPDRTNIRELRIDYTDWEANSPRTHNYADPAAAGRTLSMRFSLRDAANPAQTVKRGIRFLEFGLNPVGDRPFHHNAVHEFVHAIDAVEGLSKTLQRMLSQTWGQLSNHGLIEESWWTWLTRLPRYAFVNEAKTVLNDAEALAVGFAEADIHGAAAGAPQWAIHDYVTTGQPPQVTSDLEIDLPPHPDHPDPGGPGELIGSRPHEEDSQSEAARRAWLKALRLDRGMTQRQLAQAAGVGISALSAIESGKRELALGIFQRICQALGLAGETLSEAVRQLYSDRELDLDPGAHDPGLPGNWIAALCFDGGTTVAELASTAGISDADVIAIERGMRPTSIGFLRTCRARGVTPEVLEAAIGHFYPDLVLDLDPLAHNRWSPDTWILALQHDRDLTLAELEEAIGPGWVDLHQVKTTGSRPKYVAFLRICDVLRVGDELRRVAINHFYSEVEPETEVAAQDSPSVWISGLRNRKGMSKADLARTVGVSPKRIADIENGERPQPEVFWPIAHALGAGRQELAELARKFYSDLEYNLDPTAHDPGAPGSWIAALRYDRDMTGAELARTEYLTVFEDRERPPNSIIFRRVCRARGVSPEILDAATRHFYRDLELDLDPAAHDRWSPGSWFVALRHDRDLTQIELANAIGQGWVQLSSIEAGNYRPRFAVFRRICNVLEVGDELRRAASQHFYRDIYRSVSHASLGRWIVALRHIEGISRDELARQSGISRYSIAAIERGRHRPRLRNLRRLCAVFGVGGDVLLEAVAQFYSGPFGQPGDRDEEDLFNRYVVSKVGSSEEKGIRDDICKMFAWIPNALARREARNIRDEAVQVAWMGILNAIDNHVPFGSFTSHAWASGRSAIFRYRLQRQFPDLDDRTLAKVITVRAQIGRMFAAGSVLDDAEIARATGLKMADVMSAREILARPTLHLDASITGKDGARNRELSDPAASTGFSDTDFAMTVRAALADMPDPGTAERLVMLHVVEGMPLVDAAERLGLQVADAAEVLADALTRLRDAFGQGRSAEVFAGEEHSAPLTPWAGSRAEPDQSSTHSSDAESSGDGTADPGTAERNPAPFIPGAQAPEQHQPPVRSKDPKADDNGPHGLIGSRPFEDSPGERAFAGPGFEELVLAGLDSGIAERFVVEDAPGLRVEEITFGNGLRVFAETYSDPLKADIQVLQAKVAAVMGAPVAHAMLNLEDGRVYRELTPPGRPGHMFDVLPPEILDSSSGVLLGLFDVMTRTNRTGREWSMGPHDDVMGGRARSDVDATPTGVFAAKFVQRIDGREVWLDNTLPRWAVEDIRERVTYLESWIESYPAPEEHRDVLLDIHRGYLAALAQIERHAVPTPWEMLHRAGLDDEWRSDDVADKARLVEVFTLKYPYLTMVGFDHPHVRADVVVEILGGLDEMFTRFPGRTNIRELRIDYLGDTKASARTSWYVDRAAAAGRTERIHFSLHHAARPAPFVEFGIRSHVDGINPIGDRPFHHDAVHEFIHAIDAKEGLSENLRQVLGETYSQLSRLGLVDEHWWTWIARLPEYAFGNEAKTVLNDEEVLAVGFAEADIHGVGVGSPQWAIHEYVTTGRPPRVAPDLEVDLPPQDDPPAPGRARGLIGSRPHEDDSDAPRRSANVIGSEQEPVSLTPWTTARAEPDQPPERNGDSEPGQGSPKPGGWIGSRPHEQDEPARRPTPGQTTPWSRDGEPHPDDQLRRQPSHLIPERLAENTPGLVPLTACETEVLARVRQGMTHNEIAATLDLSVRDVRAHLASVRRKLRNQRVAPSGPGVLPSTASESERFRAAMYAALTSADQPDPRELLAGASQEQMERAVQGLSSAHRAALSRLRAGSNTPVVRSMALIAARRWVSALAVEHNRSQTVLATALAAASPAELQTALDQLTAAERRVLVDRFGPATSPASEPEDSVRALRAVDIVRHIAGRIAPPAGISAVDENRFDKGEFQHGNHLAENERPAAAQHANSTAAQTYTADECLDAVLGWLDRQDPPESAERSRRSRRGSSAATADRPDGRSHQDGSPADEPGRDGTTAPGDAHSATALSEEPGRPDHNGTGSVHADADDHWRSLPVDHGFDDEQRRLADEALRAGGFDDADMLQRPRDHLFADAAQRRATENGQWWDSLSDPDEPGGPSSTQRALIQVYPHQIGNADGLPAVIRDHANRLSIRRDLGAFIARRPGGVGMLDWIRTGLTAAERKQLGNLIHIRNHLQQLDRQAAEMVGSPPVHLLSYDSTAFHGKGKAVVALGNVDTAQTVNWHVPGTNTTSSSLAYQFKPLRNLYEQTLRVDPSLELASIIWIGYDAPAGPMNTGFAKAAFPRRARVGGHRLLCDIAAFHATRRLAGTAAPDQLVNRLYGHSYGSVTTCYAGRYGRLAGLVGSITLAGSPGAGPVRHAAEFGIGAENVYVLASWRDPVTIFGADRPGARSRVNPRLGHGIDPATEAFGGQRVGAEFPTSPNFAGAEAVHQGYLHRDPATGLPTEALANVAQITAGRGETLVRVQRRRSGRGLGVRPIDRERPRYADRDGNHFDSWEPREQAERGVGEHWGPAATSAEAEPHAAPARPSPTAGPRIAVQLGADGLVDSGSAGTDALALGVNTLGVRVGRGAEDVAALDAVCRSAAFDDATLAVEVNAGPRWSDEEVRTKVAEVVATLARHGTRGELHAFDQRVLTAAAELAPDCHRVLLINSLMTTTAGIRGTLGWMARAVRPRAEGIGTLLEKARRTGATGVAVPYPLLSEDFVRLAHEWGMRLAVRGVGGSGRMRAVIGLGVDEIWTKVQKLALLRAEVAEGGFRIPEPSTGSAQPPKATPWSQHPDRTRDR